MTCGIYRLEFSSEHFYIGKSINIEERFLQHMKKLNSGTAAKAMQACFYDHGAPSQELIIQCHPDHLDVLEPLFIDKYYNSRYCLNSDRPTIHHNEALTVDNEVYKILQMSTIEHINEIQNLKTSLKQKELEYNSDKQKILLAKNKEITLLENLPEIMELIKERNLFNIQAQEIKSLNNQLEYKQNMLDLSITRYEKEKKKSWWTKLWE